MEELIYLLFNEPIYGIIIITIITIVRFILPIYFKKLTEDLATKQNLKDIQDTIGQVKSYYDLILAEKNSKLSIRTKTQQAFYDDERTSIIEYLNIANELYFFHIKLPEVINSDKGRDEYILQEKLFEDHIAKYKVCSSKLSLLCYNQDILDKKLIFEDIMNEIISTTKNMRKLYFKEISQLIRLYNPYKPENNKKISEINAEIEKITKLWLELIELWKETQPESFLPLQDSCKLHLKKQFEFN